MKNNNLWYIIGGIVIVVLIVIIFMANSNETNVPTPSTYPCKNGSMVYERSQCAQEVTVIARRTIEQYAGLQANMQPNPEEAACNFELDVQKSTQGVCTVSSVTQDPSQNYVIVCKCIVYE